MLFTSTAQIHGDCLLRSLFWPLLYPDQLRLRRRRRRHIGGDKHHGNPDSQQLDKRQSDSWRQGYLSPHLAPGRSRKALPGALKRGTTGGAITPAQASIRPPQRQSTYHAMIGTSKSDPTVTIIIIVIVIEIGQTFHTALHHSSRRQPASRRHTNLLPLPAPVSASQALAGAFKKAQRAAPSPLPVSIRLPHNGWRLPCDRDQ